MSSILDQLNEPNGTGWRPNAGDVVVGTVLRITEGVSTFDDKPYPIVTLRTDDRDIVAIHCFHAVLKSELAKARPARGDRLGVKYEGKPAGRSYEMYRVAVEKPDGKQPGEPDWDSLGEQADLELKAASAEFDDEEPF